MPWSQGIFCYGTGIVFWSARAILKVDRGIFLSLLLVNYEQALSLLSIPLSLYFCWGDMCFSVFNVYADSLRGSAPCKSVRFA